MAGIKKKTNVGAFRAAALPVAIVLSASVLLAGCSRDKDVDITTLQYEADPPQQLYDEALANINAGKVSEALRKLKSIQDQNPLSDYARQALIMQTYLQYRSRKYEAAVTSGKRYLSLYPNSKDAAYAQYLVGLSYSKEIVDVTQDQAISERTIEAMQKVIDNYPDSEYVTDARAKIRYARDQLAGKDMLARHRIGRGMRAFVADAAGIDDPSRITFLVEERNGVRGNFGPGLGRLFRPRVLKNKGGDQEKNGPVKDDEDVPHAGSGS